MIGEILRGAIAMQDQKPKRTFRAAAGLLAYAALSLLLSQLWRLFPAAARQELPQLLFVSAITIVSMGAGAAVMLGREKKLSFYERPRWSDAMPLTEVFFAVLLIGIYLTSWAEALFSRFGISWPQADIPALHGGVMWAAAVFRYVLVPAVMEELLFRGALLHTLRPLGERGACLTAALLFTLFHTSASHWPSIFLLGLLLCYAALHTQSLVVPMLLHAANNALALWQSQLLLSGGQTQLATLQLGLTVFGVSGAVFAVTYFRRGMLPRPDRSGLSMGQQLLSPLLAVVAFCLFNCISGAVTQ